MADYNLKYTGAQIDALLDAANELKTNGYIYKGVATPSTNPGTPTERVAYLASEPGTYANFGGIVITSGLYSLTYASGTWTGTQMQAGSDIEVVQTTGQSASDVMSQKAVTDSLAQELTGVSGTVYNTAGDRIGTPTTGVANFVGIKYPVSAGDVVVVSGTGGGNARLWAIAGTLDGNEYDDNILDRDGERTTRKDKVLVMPENARWVVLNSTASNAKWYFAKAGSVGADAMLAKSAEYTRYDNSQSLLASDNVQGALDEIRDALYESEIINLNNYSTFGQWIGDSDRTWRTSSAVNCKIVPVSPNTNYTIIPISSTYPSRFCFLQSDVHTIGSIPSFCDGYSRQDVYVREPFRIKSPSNAHYIYFCFQPSDQYNIKLPQQFSADTEKYADVEVGNANDTDLDITDEIGNVLVRFYEGHIKTKNFDSKDYYGVTDKFKGKHLVIIGDSISTYGGYIPTGWRTYYTNSNLSSVNNTYWMKLCMALGMSYNNCSYSASRVSGDSTATSVTGAANECAGCSDVRINAINRDGKTPDIILVYMGTNDWINNVSLGEYNSSSSLPNEGVISTFSPAYALMLAKIRNNYPQAIIFCCTMPTNASKQSMPPFTNAQGIAVEDYNSEIRKVANIFGCNVLELANCGLNYKSIPSLSVDNVLHPNVGGHTLMFKKVLTELISNY